MNEPLDVDLKTSARNWDRERLIICRNSMERCWVFRRGVEECVYSGIPITINLSGIPPVVLVARFVDKYLYSNPAASSCGRSEVARDVRIDKCWNALVFYSHLHAQHWEDVAVFWIGCEARPQILRDMGFCERPVDVWLFGVTRCQWIVYNH